MRTSVTLLMFAFAFIHGCSEQHYSEVPEGNEVLLAVFGIKAGTDMKVNEELLAGAALNLQEKGAELIVLGCTEIPLAYDSGSVDLPYINPTRVLAEKSVEMYRSMITAEN